MEGIKRERKKGKKEEEPPLVKVLIVFLCRNEISVAAFNAPKRLPKGRIGRGYCVHSSASGFQ